MKTKILKNLLKIEKKDDNITVAPSEIDRKQKEKKMDNIKNKDKVISNQKSKPENSSKQIKKSSSKNAESKSNKVKAPISNKKDLGKNDNAPDSQNIENKAMKNAPLMESGKSNIGKKLAQPGKGRVENKLANKLVGEAGTGTSQQNTSQKSAKPVAANKKTELNKKVATKGVTSSNKQMEKGKSAQEVKPNTAVKAPAARPVMRGGKGKKRRVKPRISPAELRRRQVREWLKVANAIFGQSLYMQPPSMPYFLQKEKELLAKRDCVLQERRFKSRQRRNIANKVATSTRHHREVRHRERQVTLRHHRWALKEAEHVEQRIDDLARDRMRKKIEHQRRMHRQQMQEIKDLEQRKLQDKRNRQDEDRVTRILTAKYGSF